MISQRAIAVKVGTTLITDVRSLTSVYIYMPFEMGRMVRRIGAMWTGVDDHETGFTDQTTDDDDILNASFCH